MSPSQCGDGSPDAGSLYRSGADTAHGPGHCTGAAGRAAVGAICEVSVRECRFANVADAEGKRSCAFTAAATAHRKTIDASKKANEVAEILIGIGP